MILRHAITEDQAWKIAMPALCLIRHALELRLKSILRPSRLNHDLAALLKGLEGIAAVPCHLIDRITEIGKADRRADAFRFTHANLRDDSPSPHFPDEVLVNLEYLREVAQWIDGILLPLDIALRAGPP
jgi:hypothetical protein